jgi:hypothetical protein
MSPETKDALDKWLETQSKNIEKYMYGHLTSLEESFHRVALKYWKKGTSYGYEEYIARRSLAFLDWNERFGKEESERKVFAFRQEIAATFSTYCDSRKAAKGSPNSAYLPKKYGITDYYDA